MKLGIPGTKISSEQKLYKELHLSKKYMYMKNMSNNSLGTLSYLPKWGKNEFRDTGNKPRLIFMYL